MASAITTTLVGRRANNVVMAVSYEKFTDINLASDDAEGQSRNAAFVQRRDQDRLKRSLMNSGSHPEAVSAPGAVARCSTTTRRLTSPFR